MSKKFVSCLVAGSLLSLALTSVPALAEKLPEHLRPQELTRVPSLVHRMAVQLTNGVPVTGLSGAAGEELAFTLDVPAGARDLVVRLRGGTGDADLYVRHGAAPTVGLYDCRPFRSSSDEVCTFSSVDEGTWHVMVRGYEAFSGVELEAEYLVGPLGKEILNGVPVTGLSGGYDTNYRYYLEIPPGMAPVLLSVALYNGSGYVDLYVDHEASNIYGCSDYQYDDEGARCAVASAQPGVWYIIVEGFGTFTDMSLIASWETLPSTELINGVPVTGLSGVYGSEEFFHLQVPDNATDLRFELSGGTGDADLIVRRGARPSSSYYDCQPAVLGNEETCSFTPSYYNPDLGDLWFVLIEGYTSYSGVSLVGTYTTPLLFGDGFESGDWGAWTTSQP